jgi:hypothetical protein
MKAQMQTQEADGWSLTMFINPKRMVVDRQIGPEDTEWQTGSWSRQAEWSGRRYKVQKQAGVKTG